MESNGAIIYLTSKASFVVSFIEPKFLEILQFCGYGVLVNFYGFAFLYYANFFFCVHFQSYMASDIVRGIG